MFRNVRNMIFVPIYTAEGQSDYFLLDCSTFSTHTRKMNGGGTTIHQFLHRSNRPDLQSIQLFLAMYMLFCYIVKS